MLWKESCIHFNTVKQKFSTSSKEFPIELCDYFQLLFCLYVLCAQSCPTLCDPMNCSPPASSVHGQFQAKILEWVAPGIKLSSLMSPALAGGFFTTAPPGKPTIFQRADQNFYKDPGCCTQNFLAPFHPSINPSTYLSICLLTHVLHLPSISGTVQGAGTFSSKTKYLCYLGIYDMDVLFRVQLFKPQSVQGNLQLHFLLGKYTCHLQNLPVACFCTCRILLQEKRNCLLMQLEEATRLTSYLQSQVQR